MRLTRHPWLSGLILLVFVNPVSAQEWLNGDLGEDSRVNRSIFREIDSWPDPSTYRTAAGRPGSDYWQQQVDYEIDVALDTAAHVVSGSERITYHNNSPDALGFLWVQLDQNIRSKEHSRALASQRAIPEGVGHDAQQFLDEFDFDGGHEITRVEIEHNGALVPADYVINGTLMRVNLLEPVDPADRVILEIDWSFLVPGVAQNARGSRELVRDGWLYEIAQWYPRLSVYDDVNGWHTDQFLGRGEFYLEFGDFDVSITVPADHIVEATGVLQNPTDVLTTEQIQRLEQAYASQEPVYIIAPDEVMKPSSRPTSQGTLTWRFVAENVRDFAWVSSKTYVWDAAGYTRATDGTTVAAHSLYPRDAMPLWNEVSTRAIIQTFETYGRMAFEYPYPKAVNVHGPVFGMEYPMIAFCGARPAPDGSYSAALERALISVTIHEIGHNWFPMVVGSDERKWTWMDEGLNTFLQYYAEQDWRPGYPSRRGPAPNIVPYMRDADQVPIMVHSDLIHKDFGNNGYAKPAAGLVMLRDHVIGPELFDPAFRAYSVDWSFKHPQPADFFRSIEEGAGEDLAWFWRGWFYTTNVNDQAVTSVWAEPADSLVGTSARGTYYYRIGLANEGRLVMPVHLAITYSDGSTDRLNLPVDIWRMNEKRFEKGFFSGKEIVRVEVDPDRVFADVDHGNNVWERPFLDEDERPGQ